MASRSSRRSSQGARTLSAGMGTRLKKRSRVFPKPSKCCSCITCAGCSSTSTRRPTSCIRAFSILTATSTRRTRSEEPTSDLQSRFDLVCRLLLEKKKKKKPKTYTHHTYISNKPSRLNTYTNHYSTFSPTLSLKPPLPLTYTNTLTTTITPKHHLS